MKHLNYKVLIGITLVLIISCCIWFAAPNGTYTSNVKWSAGNGAYEEPGKIIVEKRDAVTGNLINKPGFKISVNPNPYGGGVLTVLDNTGYDAHTSNYGIIELPGVPVNTYIIKEIGVPAGYYQDAPDMQAVVHEDEIVILKAFDTPKREILIEKLDKNTGIMVNRPGVTFTVSPNPYGGGDLQVQDNDSNDKDPNFGSILLQNVPDGTYTITEKYPPEGYLVDLTPMTAVVNAGEVAVVVSRDESIGPPPVPGLSDIGMWIMIGAFALLMSGFMIWRGRRSGIIL
jgi:hypothetical protein